MARYLLNSAVIPAGGFGIYQYDESNEEQLAEFLRTPFESRIGYPETAQKIRQWTGVAVPLSRETSMMEPGDEAMVVRLKYRVQNPATKGAPVEDNQWEIGHLKRLE